ncbi:MAG: hypothetical protein HRU11_08720 [Parvularculaceae bacterium]|nr:hypothetical protein [Parvularculaceae bacterium]
MVKASRLLALAAALIFALSGGTLRVESDAGELRVKVCTEQGDYWTTIDLDDVDKDHDEHHCGSCTAASDDVSPIGPSGSDEPSGSHNKRHGAPRDRAGFSQFAWRAPPSRGPPSIH